MIHLHTPTSARPVCGAPIPADRMRDLTAYRSDITCPDCLDSLAPDMPAARKAQRDNPMSGIDLSPRVTPRHRRAICCAFCAEPDSLGTVTNPSISIGEHVADYAPLIRP